MNLPKQTLLVHNTRIGDMTLVPDEVNRYCNECNSILLIKLVRDLSSCDLRQAKDIVDNCSNFSVADFSYPGERKEIDSEKMWKALLCFSNVKAALDCQDHFYPLNAEMMEEIKRCFKLEPKFLIAAIQAILNRYRSEYEYETRALANKEL